MINKLLSVDFDHDTQFSKSDLISIFREYFDLRVQFKLGQLKQSHLLKRMRRRIALIKFYSLHKTDIYSKK